MTQRTFRLVDGRTCRLMPADLPPCNQHMYSAFGESGAEVSAGYVLRYCQSVGRWTFTLRELEEFYCAARGKRERFYWNRLLGEFVAPVSMLDKPTPWPVIHEVANDEQLVVSAEFICRCYLSLL